MDMAAHTMIHCAFMGETAWALTSDGRVVFKGKPDDYSAAFFRTNGFIKQARETLGVKKIIIQVHEDPASPEVIEAFKKMEEKQAAEKQAKPAEPQVPPQTEAQAPEAQPTPEQPPIQETIKPEPVKLKDESVAKDGDFCIAEVDAPITDSEESKNQMILDLDSLRKGKAAAIKDYNGQIDDLTDRLIEAAKTTAKTHAKCFVRYQDGQKEFVNMNGDVVKRVPITDADLQTELPINNAKPHAEEQKLLPAPESQEPETVEPEPVPEAPETAAPVPASIEILSSDGETPFAVDILDEDNAWLGIAFEALKKGNHFRIGNLDGEYIADGEPYTKDNVMAVMAIRA